MMKILYIIIVVGAPLALIAQSSPRGSELRNTTNSTVDPNTITGFTEPRSEEVSIHQKCLDIFDTIANYSENLFATRSPDKYATGVAIYPDSLWSNRYCNAYWTGCQSIVSADNNHYFEFEERLSVSTDSYRILVMKTSRPELVIMFAPIPYKGRDTVRLQIYWIGARSSYYGPPLTIEDWYELERIQQFLTKQHTQCY